MEVTIVHVSVKQAHIEDFKKACKLNHLGSVKEHGNLRFDVLQSYMDPSQFVLYEAYESKLCAAEHKDSRHYLAWRKLVEPWMEDSRVGIGYHGLYPAEHPE